VPTYSYACTACEHHFDTVQKFTDPSLTDCPECSGRLRKLFSSVGIVFKGSGFYRNDSRASAAESSSNGKSESGSNTKSTSGSKPDSESGSTSDSKSGSASAPSTSSSSASSPAAAAS
jgi:putative FmdB family regulatory protein